MLLLLLRVKGRHHSRSRCGGVHIIKPVSTFGLLKITTFIGSSHTLVVPARPLLLSAFVLADSALTRGAAYRISGGYVVPRASHRAVTGSACPGRERLMKQPVPSVNVLQIHFNLLTSMGDTPSFLGLSNTHHFWHIDAVEGHAPTKLSSLVLSAATIFGDDHLLPGATCDGARTSGCLYSPRLGNGVIDQSTKSTAC